MMATSWLLMTASIAFSYATPIEKMHPQRPLRSLFHPAVLLSMFGQAAIHLFAMQVPTLPPWPARLPGAPLPYADDDITELGSFNQILQPPHG